jgi:hypothetical protein
MDRHHRSESSPPPAGSPPSEAWLFAQAILGKPIPRIVSPEKKARAERQELERLAQLSTRHAEELRKIEAAEDAARHSREVLEWAAQISASGGTILRDVLPRRMECSGSSASAERHA